MDTLGLDLTSIPRVVYPDHAEALCLLHRARAMLCECHRLFEQMRGDQPIERDEHYFARSLGRVQGMAFGGAIAVSSHLKHIQGVPIEPDEGGGENDDD